MANDENPLVGFHFGIDIGNGVITGYFTECAGLGSEHEVIEHKVVDNGGHEITMKIPGRLKWENIVLKRGITKSMDLWDWRKKVEDGKVEDARRDGSVIMYDNALKEVARWDFERAWPVKITGPQPKADSNEIGVEEITITHEYIRRVK